MVDLISLVKKEGSMDDLPNIIYYRNNKWIYNIKVLDKNSINKKTTANDIKEWDSLTHVRLIVAIKKAF